MLHGFLNEIKVESLAGRLVLFNDGTRTRIIPYSGESSHLLEEAGRTNLIRPARVDTNYLQSFRRDIARLEFLVNQPRVQERELENLLISNPLFLQSINYRAVYSQVILERPGHKNLIPDLIAEPIDSEWVDIIELKRPNEQLLAGPEHRRHLAASIARVASQLQDYAHYFDQDEWRSAAEKKFGFKCSTPRLVAIIGRDPSIEDQRQLRDNLSMYPRLEVVTWDRLLRAAKSLPLL